MFLEGDLHFCLPTKFRLEACVLIAQFVVLIILHLDHTRKFVLLLSVLKEMIFEFAGLGVCIAVLLLPVIDLPFEGIIGLLHFVDYLFILVYLDLVIFVVVDLAIEFQLFLLQLRKLFVAFLQ